jgi:transcription termination/antitermination protein NusA
MRETLMDIIERIGSERSISPEVLVEGIEAAMVSASKKMLGGNINVSRATMDPESGSFRVYASKIVMDEVIDPSIHISLEDAQKIRSGAEIGEEVEIDVTPPDFGRIAAQSAKQVITQRIREAEREMVYDRFKNRIGDVVNGSVQRYERGNVVVDLGIAEAVLPPREQAYGEKYRVGERIKAYILETQRSTKEPQIILSRRNKNLLFKLFEDAVPEIADGLVTIRKVAREAGRRSKIAVSSSDMNVDPVGACVGMKGSRVQMVVQELRGERIDIVEYSDDPKRFVANSLKPAEIKSVEMDEDADNAVLIVRDDQLSLAIGKGGLNVRLATELTGVEIDIVSEGQLQADEQGAMEMLMELPGVGEQVAEQLMDAGMFSFEDVVEQGVEALQNIEGIGEKKAEQLVGEARKLIEELNAMEMEEDPARTELEEDTVEPVE